MASLELLPVLSVADFYSMILTTIGLTGFGFTIPEIFVLLVKFGVVKTKIIAVFFTFKVQFNHELFS
jgi:Sec-independent protein secretion pathway component TatC